MKLFKRFGKSNRETEEYAIWKDGLDHELEFWDNWADNNKEDLNWRLLPEKELQEVIKAHLDSDKRAKGINILDVGAGPITYLGNMWGDYKVNITAIDALANKYTEMLEKKNIIPYIKTIQLCAEKLTKQFSKDTFDLAYSFNALDHAYDSIKAIKEIVEVIKPGSFFLLRSFINEAINAGYIGLHQWNFFVRNNKFIIASKNHEYDVENEIKHVAEIVNISIKNELFGARQEKPILWVDIQKREIKLNIKN